MESIKSIEGIKSTEGIGESMVGIVKRLFEFRTEYSNKISFSLLKVFEYRKIFNEKEDPECGICYKHISNKVFVCAKPCSKTFHPVCMEKMIDRIEKIADQEEDEKKICYQCCYCRREFDISNYDTSLFIQELEHSRGCGYYVDDAIRQVYFNSVMYDGCEGFTFEYDMAIPLDLSFIKNPKVAKRSLYKNKINKGNKKKVVVHKGNCRR
jgi:hypothetical protein